jgi:hypothetical protein
LSSYNIENGKLNIGKSYQAVSVTNHFRSGANSIMFLRRLIRSASSFTLELQSSIALMPGAVFFNMSPTCRRTVFDQTGRIWFVCSVGSLDGLGFVPAALAVDSAPDMAVLPKAVLKEEPVANGKKEELCCNLCARFLAT